MATRLAARAKGLSEAEFREASGTEEQGRAALEKLRWPQGFTCPACGHGGHAWLAGRQLYQCNRFRNGPLGVKSFPGMSKVKPVRHSGLDGRAMT